MGTQFLGLVLREGKTDGDNSRGYEPDRPERERVGTLTPATNTDSSPVARSSRQAVMAPISCGPVRWNRTTRLALAALVVLWAGLFSATWASWGSLTVDCGREMYVAAALAKGQTLYRDVWYLYGPLAPYLNGFLFRLLGIRLEVLYWAGSLSALVSAIFLYLAGMRLCSWLAGWTAAAVVLIQAFGHSIFCFPLPYAFASVYGCLAACALLWLGLRSVESGGRGWVFAAGIAAAVALLLKLEYGVACYVFLFLLIAARSVRRKSGRLLLFDFIAVLPGIMACALVIAWMISLRGVDFITQENIMSWPTAYFMRTYGKYWLEVTGMSVTPSMLLGALRPMALLAAFVLLFRWGVPRLPGAERWVFPVSVALIALVTPLAALSQDFVSSGIETVLHAIFFPPEMVLLIALAACATGWPLWRRNLLNSAIPTALLLVFSCLLAFRLLFRMYPRGYSIYYNGPVVLSYLLLGRQLVPATGRWSHFRPRWELLLCFGCLTVVSATVVRNMRSTADWVPLKTEHGTIRVPQKTAAAYSLALAFMKQRADQGEYVLSVPEDTSLYFLSGTESPSRIFMFTPGVLAPGKMTEELIRELEGKRVRYLLWSNRKFPEYGVPIFGKDYDQVFGDYLRAHYLPLRSLTPDDSDTKSWSAVIWERVPRGEPR